MTSIYHYHPITGEFLGAGIADESPLEPGVALIPACATSEQPPASGINEVAIFFGGNWTLNPDFRGHEYWLEDGSKHTITELGLMLPANALVEPEIPINTLASQKLAAIQDEKVRVRDGGVTIDGILFDTDSGARISYLEIGMKMAMNPAYEISGWKASSGQWVTMTAHLFAQVMGAGESLFQSCFAWQEARENEVKTAVSSGDKAAVLAVSQVFSI